MTAAARRRVIVAWLLPLGALAAALLWLLPFGDPSEAAQELVRFSLGNWVVLGVLLVCSTSLAFFATSIERTGRPLNRLWVPVQMLLLVEVIVWALPPLLLTAPASLDGAAAWTVHFVLPTLALILSALQALLLFLSA